MKRSLQAFFLVAAVFFSAYAVNMKKPVATRAKPLHDPVAASSVGENGAVSPYAGNGDDIEGEVPLPELKINAALAKESLGSTVFFRLRPEERWPLASLTKLMTAVIALENIPYGAERDDLIRRMMVISDNGAAEALADTLGLDQWLALMNAKAKSLNMYGTGFSDASGLSYLNQSTADDVDKLARYILQKHPEIFEWSRAPSVTVGGTAMPNINEFAGRPDFLGGKTGFTDEASGNLITIWRTAHGPVTIIVLGTPDKSERFIQTEKLFAWLSQRFKL